MLGKKMGTENVEAEKCGAERWEPNKEKIA
jgi:hypothetical protein